MQKTPDETKRALVTCTELVMPKEVQHQAMLDALACIQQLEVSNAELLTKVEQLETKCHQLERERDALMQDMQRSCFTCKNFNGDVECLKTMCDKCIMWRNWVWRGVKEE